MRPSIQLPLEYLPIDDLRPDPANPRRISDEELEALTRSIKEFGFVTPVVARREDNVVIGGHQRLLAARRLGIKTVPVILVDLTADQAHLLNLALNRISGNWDQELLARLLADLNATRSKTMVAVCICTRRRPRRTIRSVALSIAWRMPPRG